VRSYEKRCEDGKCFIIICEEAHGKTLTLAVNSEKT